MEEDDYEETWIYLPLEERLKLQEQYNKEFRERLDSMPTPPQT